MFTDMFSYTQAGQVAGKRLRLTMTQPQKLGGTGACYVQTAVGDIDLAYAYNNEGKVTQLTYPTDSNLNTPTFSYSYDSMMRLSSMNDNSNYSQPVVNGLIYNAANQVKAINYYDATETRAYNSLMQLTNITTNDVYLPSSKINITYNYTAGSNNGKIASATDSLSGETVTYQYDSLNRLISASGSGWTQTQAYDGFGNLTGRTGTGTAQSTTISTPTSATTNRLSGYTYDANGNLISTGYTYDVENRISFANAGGVQYFYDAQNKRVWQATCIPGYCTPGGTWYLNTATVNLFGADGKQLASYGPQPAWNNMTTNQVAINFSPSAVRSYFGGKLVGQQLGLNIYEPVIQDRLGSVGKYYPYGEERNSPQLPNDQVKFATYTRDSATGNDYADQRYYTSVLGRFMTPDPVTGDAKNPQSWNRYGYAGADPANFGDPSGLTVAGPPMYEDPDPDLSTGGGGFDPGLLTLWSVFFDFVPGGGGGGGGGAPPPQLCPSVTGKSGTYYTCIHQSGDDWKQFQSDLKDLVKALKKDPKCESFLTSKGFDLDEILSDLTGNNIYRVFSLAKAILSSLNTPLAGTTFDDAGTPIILNAGLFANAAAFDADLTILHELGHFVGVLPPDPGNSGPNDALITANCGKTLGLP